MIANVLKQKSANKLLSMVKSLESLGSYNSFIGKLYYEIFYKKMIEKEIKLANLKPGMKVLHIGSGRLPMTAITLAKKGIYVTGIDNDQEAVAISRNIIGKLGLSRYVKIIHLDGSDADFSQYNAILISLHVHPKENILANCVQNLKESGKIIYREPRGWTRLFYPNTKFETSTEDNLAKLKCKQIFGKESIVVKNNIKERNYLPKKIRLTDLKVGDTAIISTTPSNNLFQLLGLRTNKKIKVIAKQVFKGPIIVDVNGRQIALAQELARQVSLGSVTNEGTQTRNSKNSTAHRAS